MAPFPSPHKSSLEEGLTDVMDTHPQIHHPLTSFQPISIFESINSVLHVTKSTDANINGKFLTIFCSFFPQSMHVTFTAFQL